MKWSKCAVALLLSFAGVANAQIGIITTYAGNDSGSLANGVPAKSAILTHPLGMSLDASGNVYIAVVGNGLIRKIDAQTGLITTVAGGGNGGDGGPATSALIQPPCDVKLDGAGNIYFSETCVQAAGLGGGGQGTGGIARIRRVDAATGTITTVAGGNSSGFAGDGGPATGALLSVPVGLAIDSSGNIFIADSGNNRIRRVDAVSGVITTVAGSGFAGSGGDGLQAVQANLNQPTGVLVDSKGNLYIADRANNLIRFVSGASGIITTIAGTGAASFNGDGIPAATASLNNPINLTLNPAGNLVFTDELNGRVRLIDNAGLIWTIAGVGGYTSFGDNGLASNAGFGRPEGLVFLPSGPLFVSEEIGNRVRQIMLPSSVAATALSAVSVTPASSSTPGTNPVVTLTTSVRELVLPGESAPAT